MGDASDGLEVGDIGERSAQTALADLSEASVELDTVWQEIVVRSDRGHVPA
jgi:hypothetical protein